MTRQPGLSLNTDFCSLPLYPWILFFFLVSFGSIDFHPKVPLFFLSCLCLCSSDTLCMHAQDMHVLCLHKQLQNSCQSINNNKYRTGLTYLSSHKHNNEERLLLLLGIGERIYASLCVFFSISPCLLKTRLISPHSPCRAGFLLLWVKLYAALREFTAAPYSWWILTRHQKIYHFPLGGPGTRILMFRSWQTHQWTNNWDKSQLQGETDIWLKLGLDFIIKEKWIRLSCIDLGKTEGGERRRAKERMIKWCFSHSAQI